MTPFQVYVIMKLDAVSNLFIIICALMAFTLFVCWMFYVAACDKSDASSDQNDYGEFQDKVKKDSLRIAKFAVFALAISLLGYTFTPSTKQAAAMVVIPKAIDAVTGNKELMALPGDVISLASEWINKLRPSKDTAITKQAEQIEKHK